ncbi:MAG: phage tail spike protein [Bacillota bacterium]|nr:phage tail spike protein [Bacillota bacterium]
MTIRARHISYDAGGVVLGEACNFKRVLVSQIINTIKTNTIGGTTTITLQSPLVKRITADYRYRNLLEAVLDPDIGIARQTRAKVVRNNETIFIGLNDVVDRGTSIRHGKNLLGVRFTTDADGVATRIIPLGKDKEGNTILLPEKFISSPHLSDYPKPITVTMEVQDAQVSDDMTLAQAYTAMRDAVADQWSAGADLPAIQMDVDFIAIGDTEEYAQYKGLEKLRLYDTVKVTDTLHGFEVVSQVVAYEYDCLTNRYLKVRVGNIYDVKPASIGGWQLPNSGVAGFKLITGSVPGDKLVNGSVRSLQIGDAVIDTAHIRDAAIKGAKIGDAEITNAKIGDAEITTAKISSATIEDLNAEAVSAVEGEFGKITAGTLTSGSIYTGILDAVKARLGTLIAQGLTTDELYARIATIAVAQITAANIETANIQWADIEDLTTAIASIVTAQIGTADIDWAHIKDLVTDTAILTQGVGGEFYFSKLAVTEANMVSLTTGELILKGTDGRFYSLSVDGEGAPVATLKYVVNDDLSDITLDANNEIVYGGITAEKLNVQNIFADSAIVRELMAANIDVDLLWAREGFIQQLKVADLMANDTIRVRIESLENGADEQNRYLTLGKLIDSSGVERLGISIGEGLQKDAEGRITKASTSVQIMSDRQTFYQNGLVGMELKDGGIAAKKGSFGEVTVGGKWKSIMTENDVFAIVYAG